MSAAPLALLAQLPSPLLPLHKHLQAALPQLPSHQTLLLRILLLPALPLPLDPTPLLPLPLSPLQRLPPMLVPNLTPDQALLRLANSTLAKINTDLYLQDGNDESITSEEPTTSTTLLVRQLGLDRTEVLEQLRLLQLETLPLRPRAVPLELEEELVQRQTSSWVLLKEEETRLRGLQLQV